MLKYDSETCLYNSNFPFKSFQYHKEYLRFTGNWDFATAYRFTMNCQICPDPVNLINHCFCNPEIHSAPIYIIHQQKKHVISASQHVEILAVAFRFCASKDFESSNELLTFNPLKNACQSEYCTNLLSGLVSPAIQVRFLWLIWSCSSGNYWKFVNWLSVPTFVFYLVFFVFTRLFDSK